MDWSTFHRIRANRNRANPVPVSIQVNITGRCPLRCWHCEKAANRNGQDLPWSTLEMILRQAKAWDCPVLYSGGEPLVFTRWRDLLREGMSLGVKQKLITSGISFPSLKSTDRQLLVDSLDELMISIDAPEAAAHDDLRGYQGLFAGITDYLAKGSRPENIWLIHVPPPDFGSVLPMLEYAARRSVGLIVQPFIFISNYPHLEALSSKKTVCQQMKDLAETIVPKVEKLAATARQMGVVSNLEEVAGFIGPYYGSVSTGRWYGQEVLPDFTCSVPWQQVTIDEYGQVQPCVFLPGKKIGPESSLEEVWRDQAREYRKEQLAGKIWPECQSCSCHFSSNYRNSLLMRPWVNRSGWGIALRKKITRYSPFGGAIRK